MATPRQVSRPGTIPSHRSPEVWTSILCFAINISLPFVKQDGGSYNWPAYVFHFAPSEGTVLTYWSPFKAQAIYILVYFEKDGLQHSNHPPLQVWHRALAPWSTLGHSWVHTTHPALRGWLPHPCASSFPGYTKWLASAHVPWQVTLLANIFAINFSDQNNK